MGMLTGDYFTMLGSCGLDCLKDIIIDRMLINSNDRIDPSPVQGIPTAMAGRPRSIDASIELARLSLAGTQNKCGLFHNPETPLSDGWYQPVGGAPSNYIVKFAREDLQDLMIVEHLSLTCAAACDSISQNSTAQSATDRLWQNATIA